MYIQNLGLLLIKDFTITLNGFYVSTKIEQGVPM